MCRWWLLLNVAGLAVGAVVGIWLAVAGYGAWAIVWQSVALSGVKSVCCGPLAAGVRR